MFNLILFGPPGSGKGTQSEKIVQKFGLVHLSTGNLLRSEIESRTPLGLEAKSLIEKGQLVPDEVVISMIATCLDHNTAAKGFLFDGFPRTAAQAEALDRLLSLRRTTINRVIALEVTEEELVDRLKKRAQTSNRKDDQDESVIRRRFQVYKVETEPVADYYKTQHKFEVIKGMGTIEDIFTSIEKIIEKELRLQQSVSTE